MKEISKLYKERDILTQCRDKLSETGAVSIWYIQQAIEQVEDAIQYEKCPHTSTRNEIVNDSHYDMEVIICNQCDNVIKSERI